MAETEGAFTMEAGDANQNNELKSSFVTKIDITTGGASNGHVNGNVIINGDASGEAGASNENVETADVKTAEKNSDDEVKIIEDEITNEKSVKVESTNKVKVGEKMKDSGNKHPENLKDCNKNAEVTTVETKIVPVELSDVFLTPKTETKNNSSSSFDAINKVEPKVVQISMKGIDELAPATSLTTTKRDGAVKLRMGTKGNQADTPVTVITVFRKTAERAPNHLALAVKRDGVWVKWTYRQYYTDVVAAAKSFIKFGLEPYHGVGILGFNSPEWLISDLGAIFAGGFATGIYATNNPEAVGFVAKHCEANVMVVENNQQLQKVLKIWDSLPCLKAVVQYNGEVAERRDNVYSWKEFMEAGKDVSDETLQQRINLQRPNKCCTLIYTSGTTGDPKGVMLSHDNLIWTTNAIATDFKFNFGSEVIVSYLPLSHIAAQLMDIYMPFTVASAVYFAEPDALKGSLVNTLREVRPTGFFGVPRVWEKFYEGIKAQSRTSGALKKKLGMWAKGVGLKGTYAMMNKQSTPFGWGLANVLLKKAKVGLGLDRCRFFMSGAAPIMKETLEFFYSLNILLHEVYGMSESTGPHTVGTNENFLICSVGQCMPGAETKLANPDEDGNGEICMGGRHVFMGYLNEPEKTKETFDEDGWLHSGDLGKHDEKGFLYITGRIKELVITAGGENVAPVPIENNVKEALPCISNCMLIGDKRKFLSMILCLKVVVNTDSGEPTNELTHEAKEWCQSIGSQATTVSDVIDKKDAVVLKAIQDGIDKANKKAVSRASNIQKWSIIPKDFSIAGGELGPTLKLRRPVVTKMYKKTIDAFYDDGESKD